MLSFQEYVTQTQQEINEIDVTNLFENAGRFTLLIDVRESAEFKDGTIEGAVTIPRGILESQLSNLSACDDPERASEWLRQQRIVIYCRSGARSALAVKSLKAMGLDDVVSLRGGTKAWCEQGYPLTRPH